MVVVATLHTYNNIGREVECLDLGFTVCWKNAVTKCCYLILFSINFRYYFQGGILSIVEVVVEADNWLPRGKTASIKHENSTLYGT